MNFSKSFWFAQRHIPFKRFKSLPIQETRSVFLSFRFLSKYRTLRWKVKNWERSSSSFSLLTFVFFFLRNVRNHSKKDMIIYKVVGLVNFQSIAMECRQDDSCLQQLLQHVLVNIFHCILNKIQNNERTKHISW